MTLYLVTDEWSNDAWGNDRVSGTEVVGIFNAKWNAMEAIRSLYFKQLKEEEASLGEVSVYNYTESGDVADWIFDGGVGMYVTMHHLEIHEMKLNRMLVEELVTC